MLNAQKFTLDIEGSLPSTTRTVEVAREVDRHVDIDPIALGASIALSFELTISGNRTIELVVTRQRPTNNIRDGPVHIGAEGAYALNDAR